MFLYGDASLDAFSNTIEEQLLNARPTRIRDNLTKRERRALKRLIRREDIIIKPADKGSGTVVMDMDCYENECLRQLNDTEFYEKIDKDITPLTHECVKRYISGLQFDKMIDDETAKYLKENSPKPGRFYTIPKIHKQGHPGRPIVSSNSHPTERISQFVDFHLQPLVTKLPSYVKDTTHFSTNSTALVNYLMAFYSLPLMYLHSIQTYLIMTESKPAANFWTNDSILLSRRPDSVISFA